MRRCRPFAHGALQLDHDKDGILEMDAWVADVKEMGVEFFLVVVG